MKYTQYLAEVLIQAKSVDEMENLLSGLLTPKEAEEFVKRIKIVAMIKAGLPHHEIAEKLGVGVATVTRGSKEIQQGKFQIVSWHPSG